MKSLKNICIVVLTTFVFGTALSCKKDAPAEETAPVHILIYTKTKAYRHECIEPGSKALQAYFSNYNPERVLWVCMLHPIPNMTGRGTAN